MINYGILQDSINYYETIGFKRIESPWTVSESISNLTKPQGRINFQFKHNDKCLVASGEQSFLALFNKGFLPNGKYQTITPCFRDDDFSVIHTKYFLKNELIITDVVDEITLYNLVHDCKHFFRKYLYNAIDTIETDIGYDLEYKGVEIGSYGIRDLGWIKYIYATGLAEPRFSRLIDIIDDK